MQIGIIGAGFVGSTTAFSLLMTGVAHNVILLDINSQKTKSEVMDISHAIPFADGGKIRSGNYTDLRGCDIIILTAGANQSPGESRLDLLSRNIKIFQKIIPKIIKYNSRAILIVATNPVDIMTEVTLHLSHFSVSRVIGSGTILDTARLRTILGDYLGISAKSVHADVIGEHGNSEVIAWQSGTAGTLSLNDYAHQIHKVLKQSDKNQITQNIIDAAEHIIAGKGATYYGIAGGLTQICRSIYTNEYNILTVSSHLKNVADVDDVCLSLPCVINKRGILHVLMPKLSSTEYKMLQKSAQTLKKYSQIALSVLNTHSPKKSKDSIQLKNA